MNAGVRSLVRLMALGLLPEKSRVGDFRKGEVL